MNNDKQPFYRVFLLDDDQCMLDLIEAMLDADTDHYFQISKFTNSPEALKEISYDPPDILILDVNLPIINGFEVCQKIKSNAVTSSVTIILITAYDSNYVWHDGLLVYHADYYMAKPFKCENFINNIHVILNLKARRLTVNKNKIISRFI